MNCSGNILYHKKWCACGDSFTEGYFEGYEGNDQILHEGIYKGRACVYPYIIGNRNEMNVINEAVCGSTMADTGEDDSSCFARVRYRMIPQDCDYITLYFGINDWHMQVPLGEESGNDTHTFFGAWNTVLEYLIETHPYAHLGMFITNGLDDKRYTDAERIIAKRWCIPALDLQRDEHIPLLLRVYEREGACRKAIELRTRAFMIGNGNHHPTPAAHRYESTVIEQFLRSI